jgi:hypothetical protein
MIMRVHGAAHVDNLGIRYFAEGKVVKLLSRAA